MRLCFISHKVWYYGEMIDVQENNIGLQSAELDTMQKCAAHWSRLSGPRGSQWVLFFGWVTYWDPHTLAELFFSKYLLFGHPSSPTPFLPIGSWIGGQWGTQPPLAYWRLLWGVSPVPGKWAQHSQSESEMGNRLCSLKVCDSASFWPLLRRGCSNDS